MNLDQRYHAFIITLALIAVLLGVTATICLLVVWQRPIPALLTGLGSTALGILVPSPLSSVLSSGSPSVPSTPAGAMRAPVPAISVPDGLPEPTGANSSAPATRRRAKPPIPPKPRG